MGGRVLVGTLFLFFSPFLFVSVFYKDSSESVGICFMYSALSLVCEA